MYTQELIKLENRLRCIENTVHDMRILMDNLYQLKSKLEFSNDLQLKEAQHKWLEIVQWIDPTTKYPCAVIQHHSLCGYVGIPKKHPLFKKSYHKNWKDNDAPELTINVHGGLTYSGHHSKLPKNYWWFGFDTNHYNDTPEICNMKYCIHECTKLAKQLAEVV